MTDLGPNQKQFFRVHIPRAFASFLTFVVDKSVFFCSKSATIPAMRFMIHINTNGAPETSPFCRENTDAIYHVSSSTVPLVKSTSDRFINISAGIFTFPK